MQQLIHFGQGGATITHDLMVSGGNGCKSGVTMYVNIL